MKRFEQHVDPRTKERFLAVALRGADLRNDPLLNKGTCFPEEERRTFDLDGLLPPHTSTFAQQQERAYANYSRLGDDVARYLYLSDLQDRNETLFYRLLVDHIDEMAPIVYTPTVGRACEEYSRIYRRPRGVYITLGHRGRVREVLRNAPVEECRVMVVTDNEAILGLGDLGVGGMGIPIGKLALYTAGAGIHPAGCLPVDLDVGTDNQALLADPLYLGTRHPRVRGEEYLALLDEFVAAAREVYPGAIVQWEDFANENAFQILERYQDSLCCFDDDIQGTGAVVVAGIQAAVRRAGRDLKDERTVFLGAGAAGGGCALALRAALRAAGLSEQEARARVVCLDSRGLILEGRPGLVGHKAMLASDPALTRGWPGQAPFDLEAVVQGFKPTVLVGMSGRPGAFREELVRAMHAHCERPVLFPLSNPTSRAEATPANLLAWTNGAAIVATGSPFGPVAIDGRTYAIGQANNVFIFPGAGLGALAVGARRLPDEAFLAAAGALAGLSGEGGDETALFPPLSSLREVSRHVAAAVGRSLVEAGAAPPCDDETLVRRIHELAWDPVYLPYRPA